METTFDAVYLILVVTLGIMMIRKNGGRKQYLLFGIMAVTLLRYKVEGKNGITMAIYGIYQL